MVLYFEKVAAGFSRYNKYTHGTALREKASEVLSLIVRANNTDMDSRLSVLRELAIRIEELKVRIRICKEIRAFNNFNSFTTGINHVLSVARQNEGWMRSLKEEGKRPESPSSLL